MPPPPTAADLLHARLGTVAPTFRLAVGVRAVLSEEAGLVDLVFSIPRKMLTWPDIEALIGISTFRSAPNAIGNIHHEPAFVVRTSGCTVAEGGAAADGQLFLRVDSLGGTESTIDFSVTLLNAVRPLNDRPPFYRSAFNVDITWPAHMRPLVIFEIERDQTLTTCFTRGNYTLAFPSKRYGDKRVSTILFPARRSHTIQYGYFKWPEKAISEFFTTVIVCLSATFGSALFSFYPLKNDASTTADLLQSVASLLALGAGLLSSAVAHIQTDRYSYYSQRENLAYTFYKYNLPIVFCILVVTMLSVFGQKAFPQLLVGSYVINLAWVYAATTLFYVGLLALTFFLGKSGALEGYECDNSSCRRRLHFRFWRKTCVSSGRVFCDQCVKGQCATCSSNIDINRAALESGIDFDGRQGCMKCLMPGW